MSCPIVLPHRPAVNNLSITDCEPLVRRLAITQTIKLCWTFSDMKCALKTRSCLMVVSVQSIRLISFNHSHSNFKLEPVLLCRFWHPTPQQGGILSSLCMLVWICRIQFSLFFCLQLALWRNLDVGTKRVYIQRHSFVCLCICWLVCLLHYVVRRICEKNMIWTWIM